MRSPRYQLDGQIPLKKKEDKLTVAGTSHFPKVDGMDD
jgi:hypothetical protein